MAAGAPDCVAALGNGVTIAEPGRPGRGRAGNNGAIRKESGRAVRASGTFKALQRARNPPKASPLSVPEDRTACPLGVRESYIAKKIVP